MRRAAASALAAVVARRPAVVVLRQDREARRHARDVELLLRPLNQQLVAARLGRRQKDAVGLVGELRQVRAEDADQLVDLVVVRLDVIVGDRPVVAEAIEALAAEVIRAESQRDAPPVIGPPAEHARAEPVELAARRRRVRLTLERPAAEGAVEFAEMPLGRRRAAAGRVVAPRVHEGVGGRVPHRPRFEHDDVGAGLGQDHGGHAAAGTGPDHADVVGRAVGNDLHGSPRGHSALVSFPRGRVVSIQLDSFGADDPAGTGCVHATRPFDSRILART